MNLQTKKINAWIVPNTHWDREWVMTQGQYQVRLVHLIDHLLEIIAQNPEYRFYMDGQTICLDDYLEIRPEKRQAIESSLANGQLTAGPWYVLADQFLENGESTIRNLLMGRQRLKELNAEPVAIGYVPDSFGSCSSLPTILGGFGIRYASFGRGRPRWNSDLPHYEFWWQGPDGSRVLAASHGYGNGIFLSYPNIWVDILKCPVDFPAALTEFLDAAKKQRERSATDNLYFSVGVDHMEPKETLPSLIKYINEKQNLYHLAFATPADYLQSVERESSSLAVYRGEMRDSPDDPMQLSGTLSSHIRLKQANSHCEKLLQRILEPLCSMTALFCGENYPSGHLQKLWKLLLANHPHDSICCVNLDQVTRDVERRFSEIENTADYLIKDALHVFLPNLTTQGSDPDAIALVVVNPLGHTHCGPVHNWVRVPKRFIQDDYTLIDDHGHEIPCQVRLIATKQKDLESVYMTNAQLGTVLSKNVRPEHPDDQVFTVLDIDFVAEDVPGFGYRTWWLKPGSAKTKQTPAVRLCDGGMENDSLKVVFHNDGTFDLHHKATDHVFSNLHYLVDREDIGDAYDYHGFKHPEEEDSRKCSAVWQVHEIHDHRITFKRTWNWSLPDCLQGDHRSSTRKEVPITILASLNAKLPRLDMTVEVENTCKDHCLRLALDTGLNAEIAAAGGNFDVVSRKIRSGNEEWSDQPLQEFVDISDGNHGLCLATKGLPAYEAVHGPNGTRLYLTLLRAVGRLGPAAGADHPAPLAQTPGSHRLEYALIPHPSNWEKCDLLNTVEDYQSPLLVEADLLHSGCWPSTGSLFEIHTPQEQKVFFTCFKQAEDGHGFILRLWNPFDEVIPCQLTSFVRFAEIYGVNLKEEILETIGNKEVVCNIPFKGLKTLRLIPGETGSKTSF